MFSITTSADGIILVTVGGQEAVGTASVTSRRGEDPRCDR